MDILNPLEKDSMVYFFFSRLLPEGNHLIYALVFIVFVYLFRSEIKSLLLNIKVKLPDGTEISRRESTEADKKQKVYSPFSATSEKTDSGAEHSLGIFGSMLAEGAKILPKILRSGKKGGGDKGLGPVQGAATVGNVGKEGTRLGAPDSSGNDKYFPGTRIPRTDLYLDHDCWRTEKPGFYMFKVYLNAEKNAYFDQVSSVTYTLHPTFALPPTTVASMGDENCPFMLDKILAYAEFCIAADIVFKSGGKYRLYRYLSFANRMDKTPAE